jgi:hypothetical protein
MITYSGGANQICTFVFDSAPVSQGPSLQGIGRSEIDVGLPAGVMMNQVKMAALLTTTFDFDHIQRRTVKLCFRKNVRQFFGRAAIEQHNDVNIVGRSEFAAER